MTSHPPPARVPHCYTGRARGSQLRVNANAIVGASMGSLWFQQHHSTTYSIITAVDGHFARLQELLFTTDTERYHYAVVHAVDGIFFLYYTLSTCYHHLSSVVPRWRLRCVLCDSPRYYSGRISWSSSATLLSSASPPPGCLRLCSSFTCTSSSCAEAVAAAVAL